MLIRKLRALALLALLVPGAAAAFDCKVLLVPADDVSLRYAAYLAGRLALASNLPVKLTTALGTAEWAPFPGGSADGAAQYPGERLFELARPVVARLRASYGNGIVIVLTGRDINGADRAFRFLFAQHSHADGISLISAARMQVPGAGTADSERRLVARLMKFMLRAVGEQLYRLPRTTDIGSVMYAPIMSLADLDAMGLRLDAAGQPCQAPVSRAPGAGTPTG